MRYYARSGHHCRLGAEFPSLDDTTWRDRLRIITEPEAAAVHCAQLTDLHRLKPSQNFIVCDAGGGTVDLAVYKVFALIFRNLLLCATVHIFLQIIGQMANLEIAEMCARSGANCGSLFLDLRFRELVRVCFCNEVRSCALFFMLTLRLSCKTIQRISIRTHWLISVSTGIYSLNVNL
jgi:hypothetical protein